ncbi:MAG: RluA family pseudouridine synthase [Planctomycetota bacterium]
MTDMPHPESTESLARARRYFAESLEDLEEAGAERMSWTMSKDNALRLDKYVQGRLKGISRSQVQKLIELGAVTVNDTVGKASQKLRRGDIVEVVVPPKPADDLIPENIPLDILYEDDVFIAVNKEAGIIVHPARSRLTGTMINALAYHFEHHPGNTIDRTINADAGRSEASYESLPTKSGNKRNRAKDKKNEQRKAGRASGPSSEPCAACDGRDARHTRGKPTLHKPSLSSVGEDAARPGVIHRLDMNTTGVILFGKQNEAHWLLAKQFEERTNTKAYLAVVHGNPEPVGVIDQPLGKHPTIREGNAVRHDSTGKHALTLYRVREQYEGYALVECEIKTGRTHQIRVHLQYIGHPIAGDIMYGGEIVGPKELDDPPFPAGSRVNISYARSKEDGKKQEALAAARMEQGDAHPDGPLIMPYPALHAAYLKIKHPLDRHDMVFTAPLHEPMRTLVNELRKRPNASGVKATDASCYIDMAYALSV